MSQKQSESDGRYSVKTIEYRDQDGMAITVMMILFDGEGNQALEEAGYRGDYLILSKVDGGIGLSTNDVHHFCNRMCSHDDDTLLDFMLAIKRGLISFERIVDGHSYSRAEMDQIVDSVRD